MMPGRRALVITGLAAAVVAGMLAVAFAAADGPEESAAEEVAPFSAEATFSPQVALFGDTVIAHVDVVVDKARVDPESMRLAADFAPFELVGPPQRRRRDAGQNAHVRLTRVLRCLSGTCVPSGQSARYEFEPARISFTAPDAPDTERSSVHVHLPAVRVFSRFTALGAGSPQGETGQPWRADVSTLPPASYRVAPGLLVALLLLLASLATVAGSALGYRALPARGPAPPPEPEPEPEPPLSPLEQALVLLEQSIRADGAADQRRALELVAEELELAEWGDRDLARAARALAWSEDVPPVEETTRLAARVRTALPEPEEITEGDGNGRV